MRFSSFVLFTCRAQCVAYKRTGDRDTVSTVWTRWPRTETGRGTPYFTKAELTFATAVLYLPNGYWPALRVFKGNILIYYWVCVCDSSEQPPRGPAGIVKCIELFLTVKAKSVNLQKIHPAADPYRYRRVRYGLFTGHSNHTCTHAWPRVLKPLTFKL